MSDLLPIAFRHPKVITPFGKRSLWQPTDGACSPRSRPLPDTRCDQPAALGVGAANDFAGVTPPNNHGADPRSWQPVARWGMPTAL